MRTIAIINQKGGCGKTTTAINLAAVLASRDKRTLLVDMDPQSHCAMGLAVPDTQLDRTIADVLRAGLDGTLALCEIVWQVSRNLDLAPSAMSLAGIEQELAQAPDRDRRLTHVLSTVSDQYDLCVIDCPPSIGLLTFNALRAAGEVIIPVETGYFSMQGAIRQRETIEMLARRVGHRVRFKVLATMYDVRTKLAREILAELRRHFGETLLPVVVHYNSKLREAASFGQPITEYDSSSTGHEDFDQLADWLLANPPIESAASSAAVGSPAGVAGLTSPQANPVLSRAAELVERARMLSQRSAAMSARLAADPDMNALRPTVVQPVSPVTVAPSPLAPIPSTPSPSGPDSSAFPSSSTLQPSTPKPASPPAPSTLTLTPPATHTGTVRDPRLAGKLSKLYGVRQTPQGLLFIQPAGSAQTLYIAGDFNGWNPARTPLTLDRRLNIWQGCLNAPPGRYRYRLVVDGKWVQDPYNKYVESNPFGELNNIVEVGLDDDR